MRSRFKVFPLAVATVFTMAFSQSSELNASVSPDGSFSKQIAIEIPPGRDGLAPKLSLVYNSNGPNGIAGVGWSISGFGGAITKDNRFYSDRLSERSAGIQQFSGPGGRLVEIDRTGTPGLYHYERESYSEIVFDLACNAGSGCWVETLPNGSRVYYGEDADHVLTDSSGATYAWLFTRVEDVYQNGYRLTYEFVNNVAYPKVVEYTTHQSKSPKLYGVEFHYVDRNDVSTGYSFGKETKLTQRLARVTVYSDISCGILSGLIGCSGNLVREYRLSYDYSFTSKKSLLLKVEEAGSDGVVRLPGQTFTYSEFTPGWTQQASLKFPDIIYSYGSHSQFPISVGQFVDVNGDGRVDWVRAFRGKSGNVNKAIWLNTQSGWVRAPYNLPDVIVNYNRGYETPMVRGQFVDVNADGLPDWVRAYQSPEGTSYIATYLNTGNGWTRSGAAKYDLPTVMVSYNAGKKYAKWQGRFVDVNGDSRVDWVRAMKQTNGTIRRVTYLNTTSGWTASGTYALPTVILDYGRGHDIAQPLGQFADVNGDGLVDWVRANKAFDGNTRITTYINTGKGWKAAGNYKLPTIMFNTNNGGLVINQGHLVDINGDGLVDWVQSYRNPQDGFHRGVWLNTGKGWKKAASSYNIPNPLIDYKHGRTKPLVYGQFIDVNSDGLVDWVEAYKTTNNGAKLKQKRTYINTGSGWQLDDSFLFPGIFQNHIYSLVTDPDTGEFVRYNFLYTINLGQLADINADGMAEWVQAYDSASNNRVWSLKTQNTTVLADRLIQVDNGIGGVSSIEYESATHLNGAIVGGAPVIGANGNSLISNRSPRKLVVRIKQTDSKSGASYSTRYEYNNGRILVSTPEKSANVGFESVTTINEQTGSFSTTWSNDGLTDYRLAGTPTISESYAADGSLVQHVEKNFESVNVYKGDNNNDEIFEAVTFTVRPASNNIDSDLFAEHAINYEPGTGGTVKLQETRSYVQYHGTQTNGKSNLIQSKQVVTTSTGELTNEKFTFYEYKTFAKAGRPLWQKSYAGGQQVSHTEYRYTGNKLTEKDDYYGAGNCVTSTFAYEPIYGLLISKTDPALNTTSITYDLDYKTYPVSTTNALGQKITRTYNYEYAKVLTETDYNDAVFTKNYDTYGRLIEEIGPDGVLLKSIDYHDELWQIAGSLSYVETKTTDESADNQVQISRRYFDGLGRVYREETESNAAAVSISRAEFNDKGQLWKEIGPYIPGKTPENTTTYSYDNFGRKTRVDLPDGTHAETTYTATDFTPSVTTTIYEKLAAPISSQTTTYDAQGNTTSTIEPGSTVSYEYDELGQLIKTTDAGNNSTTIEYDWFGRKTKMVEPGSRSWFYTYDINGNLKTQTDPKNQIVTFTYDALNRLTDKTFSTGQPAVTYEYDTYAGATGTNQIGRLARLTDETGTTIYSYNQYGEPTLWTKSLNDIINGGTIDLTFRALYDKSGRLKELTYPDGSRTRNYYANSGYLREVRLLGPGQFFGAPVVTYYGPGETDSTNKEIPVYTIARESGNGVITHIGYDPETLQAKSLKTTLAANVIAQNLTYEYYDSGDIKTITDNVDATRTQNFVYDANFRLTSATGIYGNLTYQYSAEGNLMQKGALGLTYYGDKDINNNPLCVGAGPINAVCEDTSGNVYKYDLNGNMIQRKGRDLIYDAEDRLIEIQAGGVVKQKYIYDHTGSRVVKKREDGTVTYNVDGMYEVLIKADGITEYHTKYIYGAEGDLAAQITRDSSTVTLAQVQEQSLKIVEFASAGLITKLFINTKETIGKHFSETRTPVVLYLLIILIAALIFAFIKTNIKLYPFRFANENGARGPTAIVLIFAFSLVMLGPACQGQAEAQVEEASWIGLPVGGYVGMPDVGQAPGTNNDTTLNGQVTIGAFFLHPNHQGSTSLITDANGNLVSEIHYKPYGEVYRPASSGPDIAKYKYTAQEEDPESELMYYQARYYDPAIGRFISADTIIDPGAGNMGFNRYMYVAGNPVNYTDPSGHAVFLIGLGIAMLIGGAVNTASYAIQNGGCTLSECVGAFIQGSVTAGLIYIGVAAISATLGIGGYGSTGANGATAAGSGEGASAVQYTQYRNFADIPAHLQQFATENLIAGTWTVAGDFGVATATTVGTSSGTFSSGFLTSGVAAGGGITPSLINKPTSTPAKEVTTNIIANKPGWWEENGDTVLDYVDKGLGLVNGWVPGWASPIAGVTQATLRWARGDTEGATDSLWNSIPGGKKLKQLRNLSIINKSRKKIKRIQKGGDAALEQYDGIQEAQRRLRKRKTSDIIIDSTTKSERRLKNKIKGIKNRQDGLDEFEH